MDKPKIICVVGPTACGKTKFAAELAKASNGEVISCDSMQIYKYMDIGTAKPTAEEMLGVKHHMIDFVDPHINYSVASFADEARKCIDGVLGRKKLPILCGGTGLYIDSIVSRIEYGKENHDCKYRAELEKIAAEKGNTAIYDMLREADPKAAEKIHPNNVKRVIRALEIIKNTGMSKTDADAAARKEPLYDAEIIGLWMDRERLYERINRRVDAMMKNGLLDEVKKLAGMGVSPNSTAMQAIGYKELLEYIDGKITLDEAVELIKRESRRYAKRQLTWFRRNPGIKWIEV